MTDPRRQAFAPYVRDLADRLRLRDWTVVVKDDEPEDKDSHASIHCVYGRKRALLRLSDDFLGDDPEDQRHTVVHELLHCHLDDAYWYAIDRIGGDAAARQAFDRFAEKAVDGLADAIAPLMPTPGAASTPPAASADASRGVRRFATHPDNGTRVPAPAGPPCD